MLAKSGEITAPCPVPLSLTATIPSSRMPAFSHFWIRRMMRLSLIRADWTDWKMDPVRRTPPINTDDHAHDLGRLGDLLRLRNLVDALCNRHTESAPRKESRHAIEH